MAAPPLESGSTSNTGQSGYTSESRHEDGTSRHEASPASLAPTAPTATTETEVSGELALCPLGPRHENLQVHPLLRALYELHQVGDILRQCASFFSASGCVVMVFGASEAQFPSCRSTLWQSFVYEKG